MELVTGKETVARASQVVMETLEKHFDKDVIVTAVVVVPATMVWIASESTLGAIAVGGLAYVAYTYGPTYVKAQIEAGVPQRIYAQSLAFVRSRFAKSVNA
jgi:hypothetical protein